MQSQWITAAISAIALNASVINLSYFSASNNTLPLQLLFGIISFAILFKTTLKSLQIFIALAIGLLGILAYNFVQPIALFTNPCIPFLAMLALIAGTRAEIRNHQRLAWAAIIFIAIQIALHLYFNLSYNPSESFTNRSKGFGSGTTYSIMAAYLLIYFYLKIKDGGRQKLLFIILSLIPLWSILLTQSRGAFISLAIILLTGILMQRGRLGRAALAIPILALVIAVTPFNFENVPLLERLSNTDNLDIQAYSSGRAETQLAIMNWFSSETTPLALLFGADGLNGVKTLSYEGYQFPHFDILYLVYDTGLVGAGLYLLFSLVIIVRTQFNSYILLFFLSGLHTNMILSPTFLLLSVVFCQLQQSVTQQRIPKNLRFEVQSQR